MAWMFVAVGAVVVLVVALVMVGRVTASLGASVAPTVFDLPESVQYVADRLPEEVAAQLSYHDVEAIITWQLDYLALRGVADDEDLTSPGQPGPSPVVDDDDALAYVLGRAVDHGDLADEHVLEVHDAAMRYLRAIGAVGGVAEAPPEGTEPGRRGMPDA